MSERKKMKIGVNLLARAKHEKDAPPPKIAAYKPPKGVIPDTDKKSVLAMDSSDYNYINTAFGGLNQNFKGYPYLSLLLQRPEFRKMCEVISREMTRQWITVICSGNEDKSDKIKDIENALRKFKVQNVFRKAAELDGAFGRGQIYIDLLMPNSKLKASEDPNELETPLFLDPAKISKDSLLGFTAVEPLWTYPAEFNATDPLSKTYYKPQSWYVMGKKVHGSRLLTFVSREVPDLLKPSYNFSGLSLSQMAEPYVDNWIRTRNSVGDMLHSFSINGIKTDMATMLAEDVADGSIGGGDLISRIELFNRFRDNRGCFVLDKESEEFFQFNTPLSGLDSLQAQAQEHMASVSSIPLVFLLGVTPQGLNASSEGEILVFETTIAAMQELLFRDNLETVIKIIQLSLFGDIDSDITFKFNPLRELTAKEIAEVEKMKADTDAVYLDKGVIAPEDVLNRLANDKDSQYHGLETNIDPDLDDDE